MAKQLILACTLSLVTQTAWSQTAVDESPRFYMSQGEWQGFKAVLTDGGHEFLADAAKQAKSLPMTIVDVNAWADMPTTPASQRRLADARVAAAREELIRIGIEAKDIGVLATDAADGWGPDPQGDQIKRVVLVVHY
jgi:hypothetical protein